MSDQVTIGELVASPPKDMCAWAVMVLLSTSAEVDFLKHFGIDASNHDNTVTVELRINGIEVSPREVFKQLNAQHEDMVRRQAMALVEDKCGSAAAVMQLLHRLGELARHEAAAALGIDWEERW